jgi:ubiquinone/menaquinone biosynthesis C-methylase UbiE
MLKIIEDFSGASIGSYRIEGNRIFTKLREEKITFADAQRYDYNYHFSFGIENESPEMSDVEVFINCNNAFNLPNHEALIFQAQSPEELFTKFTGYSRTDTYKRYYLKFNIVPNKTIYIANYYFRQYETLASLLEGLAAKGNADREVFGHTIEGRNLVCYSYKFHSGGDRPSVLITSGFHCPEPDTLATEAILEFISDRENREKYNQFDFYVVPIVNPDGFVHGYNACNAAQINFYWRFEENNRKDCPEAYYLWKLCEKIKPVLYFDFHGYTFQMERKKAGAYIKPVLFYEGRRVRQLVKDINKSIIDLCGGHHQKGSLTYAPSTIYTKLTARFNTITYAKYHISLNDKIQKSKAMAIESVKIALDLFNKHDLTLGCDILKNPFGKVKRNFILDILRYLLTGPLYKARLLFRKSRNKQKAQDEKELIIAREWPSFSNNPKNAVLERRRKKELRKLSAYKKQVHMLESIATSLLERPCERILEVACGTGFFTLELANKGFNVVGLEIDYNLCDIVRKTSQYFKVNSTVVTGDACKLPFTEHAFDLVFSKSFFEHAYNVDKALKEQIRVLRNGGIIIIEDGNLFNLKSLFNLLFLYPLRTHGKHGGIRWLFNKSKIKKNLYEYLPYGRDDDIKTTDWWKKRIKEEIDLVPLEITTTTAYTRPRIPSILRPFFGSCFVIARKG